MSDETGDKPQVEVSITKVVDFYGDQIPAAQGDDGEIYVPIRPLTAFLGLSRRGQQERTLRHPVMAEQLRSLSIDTGGGPQQFLCLPLDILPGWLFGVDVSRIKPELKDKLLRYQREAFKVLWNAFKGDILPAVQQPTNLTPAEQILAQAQAIAQLAQQQVDFERGLAEARSKHQTMADYMRGFVRDTKSELKEHRQHLDKHDRRISALELRVKSEPEAEPEPTISEQQAAEIALAVKNVGILLTGIKGSNGYAQVYGELYRRYGVGAYRNLKRIDYEAVLKWLKGWHEELLDKLGEEGTSKLAG
jgi:hypothetical protein